MAMLLDVMKLAGAIVVIGAVLYSQVRYFQRSRIFVEGLFMGAKLDSEVPVKERFICPVGQE